MPHERTLTLFHTNDFHNKLSSGQAAFIKRRRDESGPNSLLVDAGDAVSAGNIGVRLAGEPILQLMNETGYDAMTMGNREFHVADGILRRKICDARFPILCANMRYQKEQSMPLPVVPFIQKTLANGLCVCIVGVTVPMVTAKMTARVISSFLFDDPVETITRLLPSLRQDADVVVALTHIGIKEDHRLAECCPDLDLIVGGHSHVVLTKATLVGSVPIIQAGWFGHYLGRVVLSVDSSGVHLIQSDLVELVDDKSSVHA
jgi:2',3'-cyclic-nucleotide 2'-phosphodiesterase (5'-nucleotidase family)